jgi:sec-independent protein translocase protein TatA
MFGFSGEHLILLLIILFIFGPKKIPQLGYSFGKFLRNFKESYSGKVKEVNYKKLGEKND